MNSSVLLTSSEAERKTVSLPSLSATKITAAFIFIAASCLGQIPPKLNIENRGTNIVVFITGGTTNTQYWVRTSNDYSVQSANYYDWKRLYSRDFVPTAEAVVFSSTSPTNTASGKPMRFFKLGDELTGVK